MGDIRSWLKSTGRTQAWLADQLGTSKQYAHQVVSGGSVSPRTAFMIEDLSNGAVRARDLLLRRVPPADDASELPVEVLPQDAKVTLPDFEPSDAEPGRLSVRLSPQTVERLRRIAWWCASETTLAALVARGVELIADAYELPSADLVDPETGERSRKLAGQSYPPRGGELRRGVRARTVES